MKVVETIQRILKGEEISQSERKNLASWICVNRKKLKNGFFTDAHEANLVESTIELYNTKCRKARSASTNIADLAALFTKNKK